MNETSEEKKPVWKKWWFWLIVIVVVGAIGSGGGGGGSSSADSLENPAKMGEVVATRYFDVTVNSYNTRKSAGSEYMKTEAGPGNTLLIIDVTYKNSSSEARFLSSGEVMVLVDGKELRFDSAEVVMDDGYITFENLNPMTSITGKVVFKIPEGLKGEIFYKPARSSELIYLN